MNKLFMHGALCPQCGFEMKSFGRRKKTRDHIVPREWHGEIIEGVIPIRYICNQCNQRRAMCGHCWGAVACIEAVRVAKRNRPSSSGFLAVFKAWRMGKVAATIRMIK